MCAKANLQINCSIPAKLMCTFKPYSDSHLSLIAGHLCISRNDHQLVQKGKHMICYSSDTFMMSSSCRLSLGGMHGFYLGSCLASGRFGMSGWGDKPTKAWRANKSIHIHMRACLYPYIHVSIYTHMWMYIYVYIYYTYIHVHNNVYIYVYVLLLLLLMLVLMPALLLLLWLLLF